MVTVNVDCALTVFPERSVCEAATVTGPGRALPGTRTKTLKRPWPLTATPLATFSEAIVTDTGLQGDWQKPLPLSLSVVRGGP